MDYVVGGWWASSVSVSAHRAQIWKRETDSYGVSKWLLTRTIHLDKLLPLNRGDRFAINFAEENSMHILGSIDSISGGGIFKVETESMQAKKLPVDFKELPYVFRPFSSVYTAEMGVGAQLPELNSCTMHKMNVRLDMLI